MWPGRRVTEVNPAEARDWRRRGRGAITTMASSAITVPIPRGDTMPPFVDTGLLPPAIVSCGQIPPPCPAKRYSSHPRNWTKTKQSGQFFRLTKSGVSLAFLVRFGFGDGATIITARQGFGVGLGKSGPSSTRLCPKNGIILNCL